MKILRSKVSTKWVDTSPRLILQVDRWPDLSEWRLTQHTISYCLEILYRFYMDRSRSDGAVFWIWPAWDGRKEKVIVLDELPENPDACYHMASGDLIRFIDPKPYNMGHVINGCFDEPQFLQAFWCTTDREYEQESGWSGHITPELAAQAIADDERWKLVKVIWENRHYQTPCVFLKVGRADLPDEVSVDQTWKICNLLR